MIVFFYRLGWGEMKNKKDYRIIVSFLGGSSSDVTGSAILISYPTKESRKCILLECGMIQGFKSEQIYSDNKKMVESIPISDIDAVFLGHPHCDHSGNLSIFGSEKFKGQVIMSNQCAPITEELLINSEFLHSVLIKALNFKGKKAKPLHTEVDMYNMFDKIKYCDTHKKYQNLFPQLVHNCSCQKSLYHPIQKPCISYKYFIV